MYRREISNARRSSGLRIKTYELKYSVVGFSIVGLDNVDVIQSFTLVTRRGEKEERKIIRRNGRCDSLID